MLNHLTVKLTINLDATTQYSAKLCQVNQHQSINIVMPVTALFSKIQRGKAADISKGSVA
jgi:hypothetical protein